MLGILTTASAQRAKPHYTRDPTLLGTLPPADGDAPRRLNVLSKRENGPTTPDRGATKPAFAMRKRKGGTRVGTEAGKPLGSCWDPG